MLLNFSNLIHTACDLAGGRAASSREYLMPITPVRPGEPIYAATINALGERIDGGERLAPAGAIDGLTGSNGALLSLLKHRNQAHFELLENPFVRATNSISDDVHSALSRPLKLLIDSNRYQPTNDDRREILYDVLEIAQHNQSGDRCLAWFNEQSGRWEIAAIKPRASSSSGSGGSNDDDSQSSGSASLTPISSSSDSSSSSSSESSSSHSGSSNGSESSDSSSRSSSSASRVPSPCCENGAPYRIKINFVPLCGTAPADSVTLEWQGSDPPHDGTSWRSNDPPACPATPARGVFSDGGNYIVNAAFTCSSGGEFNLTMNLTPTDCEETRTCGVVMASGAFTDCESFYYEGTHASFGNGLAPDVCFGCTSENVYIVVTEA